MVGVQRSAVERQLRIAAALLGWDGEVLSDVELLGDRVDVIYRLDEDRHRRRLEAGVPPLAEPWMLRCIDAEHPWVLQESAPVICSGFVARRERWPAGRRVAAGFSAFGPVAALLAAEAVDQAVELDADRLGIGLLVDLHGPRLLVPAAEFVAPEWILVRRLVQEVVYSAVCARGLVTTG